MKDTVKFLLGGFAILVIGIVAIIGIYALTYPTSLAIQRNAVEQSKSFIDSHNVQLENHKLEYSRLEVDIAHAGEDETSIAAYKAQQDAIIDMMCQLKSTMDVDTINPQTLTWLNSKGGCQ